MYPVSRMFMMLAHVLHVCVVDSTLGMDVDRDI
jgi:hypothetical protein